MRKILGLAVATSCLLSLTVPAAGAADSRVTVFGHDLATRGLLYNSSGCLSWGSDPIRGEAPASVFALYKKPGKIGTRAIGWQFGADGATPDSEAGPLAYLSAPDELTSFTFSAYVADGTADTHDGDFVAFLDANDSYTDDYYVGSAALDATGAGWNTWAGTADQADRSLTWLHWLGSGWEDQDHNGQADTFASKIRDLAQAKGAATTAFLGPELGCNERWYVDDVRVTTGSSTRTYDFEGVETASLIAGWRKRSDPANKIVYDLKHFTRNYGERDYIGAYTAYFNDLPEGTDAVGDVKFFRGKGTLYTRKYGSRSWHRVATKPFSGGGGAAFKLKFTKHADYQFRYSGSTALMPNNSHVLSVDVRARIKGKLVNKQVYQGARLTVTGKRAPGDRGVKVYLQQRRQGHWRTISTTRTKRHGSFRVGAKAASLGKWELRVAVAPGKGNLGNQTRSFTVTVKKHPAPSPSPVETVIVTPPSTPCTTCAGGTPDIPIPRQATAGHAAIPALEDALAALRSERGPTLPRGLPLHGLLAALPRRLAVQ